MHNQARPSRPSLIVAGLLAALCLAGLTSTPAAAQKRRATPTTRAGLDSLPGFIWAGSDSILTQERLVAYAAPILWFSPDEPNLAGKRGKDIRIPEAFPFEPSPDSPVVYFMVNNVFYQEHAAAWVFRPDSSDRAAGLINLSQTDAFDLTYLFYYATEEGLGAHQHDVEYTTMKMTVYRQPSCGGCEFALSVEKVMASAHALSWYANTLVIDQGARFPMRILVEEGKHASCTDKNGDGYYTPGYDVNRRINDAWGVRDVISSGALFSGGFQSWMAKVRQTPDRVMPPLPDDSPLRGPLTIDGVYAPDNAIYELRPFPVVADAPEEIHHHITNKGDPNWPILIEYTDAAKFDKWLEEQSFTKSLSISYRYDGHGGVAAAFPLFIVKNYNVSLTGGWLVNRVYIESDRWAWTLLYTNSASNWIGSYFSGGIEWVDTTNATTNEKATASAFVAELGMKFRVNMTYTPLKPLAKITELWGLRVGVKATGGFDIDQLTYVLEFGAGAF